ncbi:hypothetical protein O0L34_g2629 [Tuta absoluta]|nr:hypothetical protein O0L34_g2629 [Tuta absoluta]
MKWSKKMLKRMLNITVENARVLLEKSRGRTIDSLAFRLELVSQIMERPLKCASRRPGARATESQPTATYCTPTASALRAPLHLAHRSDGGDASESGAQN